MTTPQPARRQAAHKASAPADAALAKRARAKILGVAAGGLAALVGAWFVYFAGPPMPVSHGAGQQPRPITARVISEHTLGYSVPSAGGHIAAEYSPGESLTFTGYCIGSPAPSVQAGGTDERWLIGPHGILVSAGDLAGYSTHAPPVPCPGERTVRESRVLAVDAQPARHAMLVHATVSHASIVGVALFWPRTQSWKQVAKRTVSGGRLTLPIVARRDAAVILAACWAYGVPALRPTPGNYVARVIALPGTSGKLTGIANAATPQGALEACAPPPEASGGKAPAGRRGPIVRPARRQSTITPASPTSTTPPATGGQREASPSQEREIPFETESS
jgi:hypothetical protein